MPILNLLNQTNIFPNGVVHWIIKSSNNDKIMFLTVSEYLLVVDTSDVS